MLEAPINRSSSNAESQQGIYWRDTSVLSINGPMISKKSESPDYSVGLGAQVFSSGKHEIDFTINRRSEGILYIGVAVPHIAVDKTWCRRDCTNQAWYYFGTGLTNALRNGWDDVVSKEVGGPEMKVLKSAYRRHRYIVAQLLVLVCDTQKLLLSGAHNAAGAKAATR